MDSNTEEEKLDEVRRDRGNTERVSSLPLLPPFGMGMVVDLVYLSAIFGLPRFRKIFSAAFFPVF